MIVFPTSASPSGPVIVLLSAMSPGPKWSKLPETTVRLSTALSERDVTASANAEALPGPDQDCRWGEFPPLALGRPAPHPDKVRLRPKAPSPTPVRTGIPRSNRSRASHGGPFQRRTQSISELR